MKRYTFILLLTLVLNGCDSLLNNTIDTQYTPEQVYLNYDRMRRAAAACYINLGDVAGFYRFNNSLEATMTDEAEETDFTNTVQLFNSGNWNQYNNPDNVYNAMYEGIYRCNDFLERSVDYKNALVVDTITAAGKEQYAKNVQDIAYYRAEARFLKSFYYFELMKRYGGVALVRTTIDREEALVLERAPFDTCVAYVVSELDAVSEAMQVDWNAAEQPANHGRATKGAALLLKSRVLLYAASPLNNPNRDTEKYLAAAQAAKAVIDMKRVGSSIKPLYELSSKYQDLFIAPSSYSSSEVIFFLKFANSNLLEKCNYPIGTSGGKSGVAPTQNLVDAYEHLADWNAAMPYDNVDPRLSYTIATNQSQWNGRTIQSYVGGIDGPDRHGASRTGYYLKKFLSPSLNLTSTQPGTSLKCWIFMRYAEALLNYAEAMNEVYGPNGTNNALGLNLSARAAVNQVRKRSDVGLSNLAISDQVELAEAIRRERQVELAFEGHRAWDLRRWKEGKKLAESIRGVRIVQQEDGTYEYSYVELEQRSFDENKMYLYPIPQDEVNKQPVVNVQNPGW